MSVFEAIGAWMAIVGTALIILSAVVWAIASAVLWWLGDDQ